MMEEPWRTKKDGTAAHRYRAAPLEEKLERKESLRGDTPRAPRQEAQRFLQPDQIGVSISLTGGPAPKVAVPNFIPGAPDLKAPADLIGQVLWDDLNYEREFYMLPRDTYATVPAARTAEQVPFAAWRELGADAVVFGTVERIEQAVDANDEISEKKKRGETKAARRKDGFD